MKIYNRAQWFLYSILSNYPGALSPAPTSSLAPAHPRTLLLANLVLLLLKWFTWLTMRPKPSYLHQSPKALALAVWPPTRQKLVRPSSQVTFSPSHWSLWLMKMGWARQWIHELKTFVEHLTLILLLQVDRQKSRFPPTPLTIVQLGSIHKLGSICSKGSLGNHTALFPLCLLGHEAACWPLPAQTGKNTSPSIIKVWNTPRIVQLIDYISFAIMMRRHEQNHGLLTNNLQVFLNTTFLSKLLFDHWTELCCW